VFNTAEYIVFLSRFYGLGAQNPNCASYRAMPKRTKTQEKLDVLKGWQQIAIFLGQPLSVAQRWAKSGMPVTREGRNVYASPEELTRWLGHESAGEPVQIASDSTDLSSELKRGLSYVRKHTPPARRKKRAA
jgi:hypothetical protein